MYSYCWLIKMTQGLCWHQLNIILLKHPFVVRFQCSFSYLNDPSFIFSDLLGEGAAPQHSRWCSGPSELDWRVELMHFPSSSSAAFPSALPIIHETFTHPLAENGALSSCSQSSLGRCLFPSVFFSWTFGVNRKGCATYEMLKYLLFGRATKPNSVLSFGVYSHAAVCPRYVTLHHFCAVFSVFSINLSFSL